jgi:hypothetical protein
MDTISVHRWVGLVRDALTLAGLGEFTLWRVEDPTRWFDLGWLFEFIDGKRHRALPLVDLGVRLSAFETRGVQVRDRRRTIVREGRDGFVYVVGDCAVAHFSFVDGYGDVEKVVIAGERRAGAFQKFLDAYGEFDHRASRRSGWIEVVGGSPIPRPEGLDWGDVVLPADQRNEIRQQVDSFFDAGGLYRRLGIPYRRGLLFTGPPGNGKTSALRIIASRRSEPFVWMTGSSGPDDDRLDRAIDRAVVLAPAILCLEDVDSLLKEGAVSQFLNRIDGLAPLEGVLILATTNHPEDLDEAITNRPSRFDRVFVFDNPAAPERRAYLRRTFGAAFDERLVAKSDGLSYAQLKEAWITA